MNSTFILLFRVVLYAGVAVLVAYFGFQKKEVLAAVFFLLLLLLVYLELRRYRFLQKQLTEFAEAVKYRDFTRRYAIRNPSSEQGKLFAAFNAVNQAFSDINRTKEIQHYYLEKVINMLNSGIIFYEENNGQVIWMNDSFKQMFNLPHLSNIETLRKKNTILYELTIGLQMNKEQVASIQSKNGKIKFLMQNSGFETNEGTFRIVVYQNINDAMDESETKAWHKLLRVLTHEIMNSIAPISSLAETLHDRLEQLPRQGEIDDLKTGITTIKNRSEGLLHFAKSYRLINKVDQPELSEISIVRLFENVYQLLEPTFLQKNIDVDIILKNTRLMIHADVNLMEQVLINLMLNALDAVKDVPEPYISMQGKEVDGTIQLIVEDNGEGIPADLQEQIFTPFFTTKKSGTGVGLTLTKQIMLLHKGSVFINSKVGKGTAVILQF